MKAAAPPHPQSPRRWWLGVAVATVVQLAVVWWLSARGPAPAAHHRPEPRVVLPAGMDPELRALLDPTLFAWGATRGHATDRLPATNRPARRPPRYTEPPRWLAVNAGDLPAIATVFADNADAIPAATAPRPPAPNTVPDVLGNTALRQQSTCTLSPELAGRRLPDAASLPSWSYPDVLAATTVQLTVDAAGRVQSVTLLARSGLAEADEAALTAARRWRFTPLPGAPGFSPAPVAPLRTGEAVFRWRTEP